MSSPPGSVGVTAQTTTTKVTPSIRFDRDYLTTVPCIIKIAIAVVSLIGFVCIQTVPMAAYMSAGGWYAFVSMTAFWVTLFLIIAYAFHIIEKTHFIPWLLVELVFSGVWTAFFFIAGCVAASKGGMDPGFGAASFFAFVAMILFGFEAFQKFKLWRSGGIAQGERTVTTSQTSTAPSYPTY